MRNGVLGVIGEALSQALSSPELDEQGRVTRNQLLDKLEVSHYSPCIWLASFPGFPALSGGHPICVVAE